MLTKTHVFHNFEQQFLLFLSRNRYVPFKCLLYNFLRSFKWYTWFFISMNMKIHFFKCHGQRPILDPFWSSKNTFFEVIIFAFGQKYVYTYIKNINIRKFQPFIKKCRICPFGALLIPLIDIIQY